ncbi:MULTISPECIES: pyridoxal-phosphate dependent enzyme [unclassified Neptuniibacter]|uniref:1-aminocyclopropane-1-carboxylate deaminase/D-cysteine desulfhydrase n=1 Tax=unclassified Neptuniibacter TaxID=2630693 RepID=UPI000C522685|nr:MULTISPECIES: pyridoxal-phosphate dependent enzyme [unclassified Neptuniibacter]MAY41003.1 1-aminocyclopropane-1-carboxylate deaminase [Oceanospirillaceae bacterium]|tara:strand:- start:19750 stop:20655 length:906 start_codon:yes stop_codon:yes gene_type:complete
MFEQGKVSPIIPIKLQPSIKADVALYLLRLDLTDEYVSGNKWFKLKYNLNDALLLKRKSVLSFGGAFSNHIHALAWAGKKLGIKTVGVIRGEPEYASNPTLTDAARWGMELLFVSRSEYRKRNEIEFVEALKRQFDDPLIIPEGGSNHLAVKGASEIVTKSMLDQYGFNHIVLPCGTGGTLAGVAVSQPEVSVLGVPVLKGAEFLVSDIQELMSGARCSDPGNWSLDYSGHCGGYGKTSKELIDFIEQFHCDHNVSLDQIYTGKMMMRLFQLIENGAFSKGSKILAIHTGGLQGLRSLSTS